jgi:hypothetical protein
MPDLTDRLQELIGSNEAKPIGESVLKHKFRSARNQMRKRQRRQLSRTLSQIAEDLEGLLPKKITAQDMALPATPPLAPTPEWAQITNGKDRYNALIDQITAAIHQYTGGRGDNRGE